LVQLRPIVPTAAFDLNHLSHQLALACHKRSDGEALRIKAEAGLPLAVGGSAIVSYMQYLCCR
jgi:hypothetical protein